MSDQKVPGVTVTRRSGNDFGVINHATADNFDVDNHGNLIVRKSRTQIAIHASGDWLLAVVWRNPALADPATGS